MNFATTLKNARADQITAAIDAGAGAGKLEIGTTGMASVLASFTLSDPSAAAGASGVWTMSGAPKSATGAAAGKALAARVRTSADTDVLTALTVGLNSTVAPAWVGSTAYTAGQFRANGANVYKCMTGGTSAASGGPTGTGTGITDGTVTWDWYCVANADIKLDNLEITNGQTVNLTSFTITEGN